MSPRRKREDEGEDERKQDHRWGSRVRCPFCFRELFTNYFKNHVFGNRFRPPGCVGARKAFPEGMTMGQYKEILAEAVIEMKPIESDPAPSREKRQRRAEPLEKERSDFDDTSGLDYDDEIGETSPPKRKRRAQQVDLENSDDSINQDVSPTKCEVCKKTISPLVTLHLPCCFRQRTCLWCVVQNCREKQSLKCNQCGFTIVPPTIAG